MAKPQQPELHRSGRGATDPDSAKATAGSGGRSTNDAPGPVPEDNRPGHRPDADQDKPSGPPPRRAGAKERKDAAAKTTAGKTTAGKDAAAKATAAKGKKSQPSRRAATDRHRFAFAFDPRVAPTSLAFGVTPRTASVEIADGRFAARFGPWSVVAALDDIEDATVTGPYRFVKVAGPPRVSLADRGLTFATTTRRGVCVRFRRPVRGIDPLGVVRHPNLTVTVEDPEALVAAIEAATR